jgi:hypothetical protein
MKPKMAIQIILHVGFPNQICFPNFAILNSPSRMKRSRFLQVAILLLSLTLAGSFVAYRAGVFRSDNSQDAETAQDTTLPSTKSMTLPQQAEGDLQNHTEPDPDMISSSKSGKIFTPDDPQKEAVTSPGTDRRFIGSSKSYEIFEAAPANGNSGKKPLDDHFIPSSKSGGIFRPKPQEETLNAPSVGSKVDEAADHPVMHKEPDGFISGHKAGNVPPPRAKDSAHVREIYMDDDFMGSSKSAPIFYPPAKVDTNKPKNK